MNNIHDIALNVYYALPGICIRNLLRAAQGTAVARDALEDLKTIEDLLAEKGLEIKEREK
jgi:hypothetical protein